MRFVVLFLAVITGEVGRSCRAAEGAAAAASQPAARRVLVIYSDDRLLPANVIVDDSIRKAFAANPASHIEFFTEVLDVSRFAVEAQEQRQSVFFREKYAAQPPDLIITVGTPALQFLVKFRASLFTQVPAVFLAVPETQIPATMPDDRIVGIPANANFTGTIELALRLHPQTREIAVVCGVSPHDLEFAAAARRELQPFEKQVSVHWVTNESLEAVRRELANLPEHTVVLYAGIFEDRAGETFIPRQALAQIAPASHAPIYGIFDTYLGFGVVGGSMITFDEMGQKATQVGIRILAGEAPKTAVLKERHQPIAMFDWNQLQRAGISEKQLPAGSVIRFRDPSLWERYHWQISGLLLFFGAETALIITLVVQLRRRQRAEASRRESESRLRRATDDANESEMRFLLVANSAPVLIWISGADKLCTFFNQPWLEFTGRAMEKELGNGWAEGVHPEDLAACLKIYNESFDARASFTMDYRLRRHDGAYRWLTDHGIPRYDSQRNFLGYIGSCVDITARKESEEQLRLALEELQQIRTQLKEENTHLRHEVKLLHGHHEIVGQSPALQEVLASVEQVAGTDSSVLLLGETGTGKELIARAIHNLSPRRDRPMVCVNCAAIPVTLIESELFGREKGAYTGALTKQFGRFEAANHSTLFLDEVGELPLEVQVKLLRVLQEKEIERLGSPKPISVDVRIVAATNRDLEQAVREGRFRQDLYYRLTVFPIKLPPLRDRAQDIPLLVMAFVDHFSKSMGKQIEGVSNRSMDSLTHHSWPGNVRELRNCVERAMILNTGPTLHIERPAVAERPTAEPTPTLDQIKVTAIIKTLERTNWRIRGANGAAEVLGVKPTTLEAMMLKLGIQRQVSNKP